MELGHIGFEVSDMPAWRRVATEVIGLQPSGSNADGSEGYRVDQFSQRIFLTPGARDDISAFGFWAKDMREFDTILERVAGTGANVEVCSDGDAALRRVNRLARFRDPGGLPLELGWSARWTPDPFFSAVCPTGFVTGPMGLGHCLFLTSDLNSTLEFYVGAMGMAISETALAPWRGMDLRATFLNCNARHHSIAFAEVSGPITKYTTHFELHLPEVDDVGRAYDRTRAAGIRLSNTLGRHTDGVLSFYAETPSGFDFELGTGGFEIDGDWRVRHMDSYVFWGHEFVGA